MAELVKLDTDSLRATLPELEQERLIDRESAKQRRRSRRKTVSDGVAAMAAMGTTMSLAAGKALGTNRESLLKTNDDSDLGWVRPGRLSEIKERAEGKESLAGHRSRRPKCHSREKSMSDGAARCHVFTTTCPSGRYNRSLIHLSCKTKWHLNFRPH